MIPASVTARFPDTIQARGADYFRRRRVRLIEQEPDHVSARVTGTEPYAVAARIEDGALDAECDCPYALDHGGTCKHVWATLLAADAAEILDWTLLDPSSDLPPGVLFTILRPGGAPRCAPDAAPKRPGRQWKNELQAVRHWMHPGAVREPAPAVWPADRRLVYVVDVPASLAQQRLTLEVATERQLKDGTWDRAVPFRLGRDVWAAAPDARDRTLMQMLLGARAEVGAYHGFSPYAPPFPTHESTPHRFQLGGTALGAVLPLVCETERCRVRLHEGEPATAPLVWDAGPPWRLALRLAPVRADGAPTTLDAADVHAVRLDGVLRRDADELPLALPVLVLAEGVLVVAGPRGGIAARVDLAGAWPLAARLRVGTPLAAAPADVGAFVEALAELPALPPLALPPGAGETVADVRPAPRVLVRAARSGEYTDRRLVVEPAFDYAGSVIPAARAGRVAYDGAARRLLVRDLSAERAALARLAALGVREAPYGGVHGGVRWVLPPTKLDGLVAALTQEGWHLEVDGVVYRTAGALAARVDGAVEDGIDWFDLAGAVDFGGVSVPFPRLLDAVRRGARTVPLDDGSHGVVPAEWLARLAPLAALGATTAGGGALRFSRAQVPLLDALLDALPAVDVDATFARARDALLAAGEPAAAEAPPGFAGALRPYQARGLGWLHWLRTSGLGGCLADDMGLGKTVQVLALLEARRAEGAGPSIVVAPRSLLFNWQAEAARFAPGLRVLDHTGTGRARTAVRQAIADRGVDLILTTYGTLRQDAAALREVTFDYAILDEAQAIKNAATAAARAARTLNARHRLALTGTPVENRLEELRSLFDFLAPGLLGGARAGDALKAAGAATADGEAARTLLARALRPFILRRTKSAVAPELPPRQEQTLWVELEGEQRRLYDELRDHYRAELLARVARDGMGRARMHVLEALLRLRQAACHAALVDPARDDVPSAKLDVLHERIGEALAEGHKVLVFSQFTSLLAHVRARMDEALWPYEYLDGQTRDRAEAVRRFQEDPAIPVFLISLKAGGTGLNLTAAEYVFLLDPWWNPAVEAQAIDRAHRIGQTRHVLATRLVARGTVEERVVELQARKRALADAILSEDAGGLAGIGAEELKVLLG